MCVEIRKTTRTLYVKKNDLLYRKYNLKCKKKTHSQSSQSLIPSPHPSKTNKCIKLVLFILYLQRVPKTKYAHFHFNICITFED